MRKLGNLQFGLLCLAMISAGVGLTGLNKNVNLLTILIITLSGILVGWWLARSRIHGLWGALITIFSGILTLIITVGQLYKPLFSIFKIINANKVDLIHGRIFDKSIASSVWLEIGESINGLIRSIESWVQTFGSGPVADNSLAIGFIWGFTLFLIAAWAAWMIRRNSWTLIGLLPGIALLAFDVYYTESSSGLIWLLLLAFFLINLQAIQNFMSASSRWHSHKNYKTQIEPRLLFYVVLIAIILVLVGAYTPSISIQKVVLEVNRMFEKNNNAVAESLGLDASGYSPGEMLSEESDNLSSRHIIIPPKDLTTDVIMTIEVEGYRALQEEMYLNDEIKPLIRYYWKSQSFDQYTGQLWNVSSSVMSDVEAGELVNSNVGSRSENYEFVRQYVTRIRKTESVYATGELRYLDRPARIILNGHEEFVGAATAASKYTAESQVLLVPVGELKNASTNYADEIREYYLQLPAEFPQKVRDLAFEITSGQNNPYDKALALETFLRQYPYSLDVPVPPIDKDIADYFLFELQKGYCDYFATTMVVMARSVGIPTRLVVGYTRGEFDFETNSFVVIEKNAHSWVEVFFPDIGWVEFEPTSNQPDINRLVESESLDVNENNSIAPTPSVPIPDQIADQKANISPLWWVILSVILIASTLIPMEGWLLHLKSPIDALIAIQMRLFRQGRKWNVHQTRVLTPNEFKKELYSRLERFTWTKDLQKVISLIHQDLEKLTEMCIIGLYSRSGLSADQKNNAIKTWQSMKFRLIRLRWLIWWKNILRD